MAEINSVESIVNPELPKVLDNEQIHVYVPKAGYNVPGIAAFTPEHFTLDVGSKVRIRDSIMQTIGTGTLIVPDDLSPGESGLVGLANSNYRNLHRHIGLSADSDAVLPLAEDPHKTQLAIRTRIRKHNEDENAHPYIREQIPTRIKNHNEDETAHPYIRKKAEDDLKTHNEDRNAHPHIQGRLSELDAKYSSIEVQLTGKGYVYTIASWEALKEAITNPDQRVFTLREDSGEEIKLRLLDLVTGDTIYVLEPDAPDFYVVKANVVDETIEPEVYQGLELTYSFLDEIAGYLFTQGKSLSNLVDGGGAFSLMTPDSVNSVEAEYSIALGKNNTIRRNVLSSGRKNERVHVLGDNFSTDDLTDEGLYVSDVFVTGQYNKITTARYTGGSFVPNTDQSFSSYVDINGFANYVKGNFVSVRGVNNYSQIESVARVFGMHNELYGDEANRIDAFGGQNVVRDSTYVHVFGLLNDISKSNYLYVNGRENKYNGGYDVDNGITVNHSIIHGYKNSFNRLQYTAVFGEENSGAGNYYTQIFGYSNSASFMQNSLLFGADNVGHTVRDSLLLGDENLAEDGGSSLFMLGSVNMTSQYVYSVDDDGEPNYTETTNAAAIGSENSLMGTNLLTVGAANSIYNAHDILAVGSSNSVDCENESDNQSFVVGRSNRINNSGRSVVVGINNRLTGNDCIQVIGKDNLLEAVGQSIIIGQSNNINTGDYLLGLGSNNRIVGNKIINFGYNNNIEGNNQIILTDDYRPKDNNYYLDNFIGIGSGLGFGTRSILLGTDVSPSLQTLDSILLGNDIFPEVDGIRTAERSLALGQRLRASQRLNNSILLGSNLTANGSNTVIVGYGLSGQTRSVLVGDDSTSRHDSVSVGFNNLSYSPCEVIVGCYNQTHDTSDNNGGAVVVGTSNGVGHRSITVGAYNNHYDDYNYPLNSITVGTGNVGADNSIIVGENNSRPGQVYNACVSVGVNNKNLRYSLTIGHDNCANTSAVSIGEGNNVTGNSVAVGKQNATGSRAIAVGMYLTGSQNSAIIGTKIYAGTMSLGVGETIDVDNYCVAVGQGITSYADGQLLFGVYPVVNYDTVMAIGRGTSSGRKNVFAVSYNEDDGATIWFGNSILTEEKLSNMANDVNNLKNQLAELDALLQEV